MLKYKKRNFKIKYFNNIIYFLFLCFKLFFKFIYGFNSAFILLSINIKFFKNKGKIIYLLNYLI